jgi:hypothetical protein
MRGGAAPKDSLRAETAVAVSLIERQLGLQDGAGDGRRDPLVTVEEACNSRWRSPRRDRYLRPEQVLIDSNVTHAASTKKLTASTGERDAPDLVGAGPATEPLYDNHRRRHLALSSRT